MKKSILTLALMISVHGILCAQNWSLLGNAATVDGTNFIGTTDNKPLNLRVNNQKSGRIDQTLLNTFFGYYSGASANASSSNNSYFGANSGRLTTSANNNTAVGFSSLYNTTTGYWNTASGASSLYSNTTGHNNTAIGRNSMYANLTGYDNTATGSHSLRANSSGIYNTANGSSALYQNVTGNNNTAFGTYASYSNNTASNNTAIGYRALFGNTNGEQGVAIGSGALHSDLYGGSVAVGYNALYNSTTMIVGRNVAIGHSALYANTTGGRNTGIGTTALLSNTTGTHNSATGCFSMTSNTTGTGNSAFGDGALSQNATGNYNSVFGSNSGPNTTNLSNTTALGANVNVYNSNTVRVGDSFVTNIQGYASFVNISDGRFKKEIKEEVPGLSFVTQLRPVSYILDRPAIARFDGMPDSIIQQHTYSPERQTGFIAQEVEAIIKKGSFVFDGVDAPKHDKDHYGIRYSQFVVPLVKAIQELNAKLEEQQQTINALLLKGDSSDQKDTDAQGAVLYNNNPNPFSSDTEIKMRLPETSQKATLIVYNMEGKELKSVTVNTRGETGVKISSHELSAGMYLYTLIVDGKFVDAKRMILTR